MKYVALPADFDSTKKCRGGVVAGMDIILTMFVGQVGFLIKNNVSPTCPPLYPTPTTGHHCTRRDDHPVASKNLISCVPYLEGRQISIKTSMDTHRHARVCPKRMHTITGAWWRLWVSATIQRHLRVAGHVQQCPRVSTSVQQYPMVSTRIPRALYCPSNTRKILKCPRRPSPN